MENAKVKHVVSDIENLRFRRAASYWREIFIANTYDSGKLCGMSCPIDIGGGNDADGENGQNSSTPLAKNPSATRLGRYLKNSPELFSEGTPPPPDPSSVSPQQPSREQSTTPSTMLGTSPVSSSPLDDSTIPRRIRVRPNSVDIQTGGFGLDFNNEARVIRMRLNKILNKYEYVDYCTQQVLVLYTGGTIGMVRNSEGALAPFPHAMEDRIRATITMHDEEYSKFRFSDFDPDALDNIAEEGTLTSNANGAGIVLPNHKRMPKLLPLVLPHVPDHKRVIYAIYEYDPLLDSSNMTMDDWIAIAKDIKRSYEHFDGFVILHGTDTLAYTASALSFMLEHLGKPVIVTGSQIPCFETRSDGRDNFVGALILAGNYNIPEVCVYFRHQLMRGNRTVKLSAGDLDAFNSPNMNALVKAGIDFKVDHASVHRPKSIERFRVHTRLDRNVVLLRLFPSIGADTIKHFLTPPIKGVVLQCYGAGNMPSNRQDILDSIKEATDRGVIIISVSQCISGGVSGLYETGKVLLDAGVICGADITTEAALTKLSYVLSKKDWDMKKKRAMMQANIAGEITVLRKKDLEGLKAKDDDLSPTDATELDLIQAVAKCLSIKTTEELENIKEVLFPSLLCAAVYKGSLNTLTDMKSFGGDVAMGDYDKRTPLHIAAAEGKLDVVEFLLKSGASVHVRDRNSHTPLMCAIDAGFEDVVKRLVECGAHLQLSSPDLGELICNLARRGKKYQLHCYRLAGVNMETKNMSGSTALHGAVETGQVSIVEYLVQDVGVDVDVKNLLGHTPHDLAVMLKRPKILKLLEEA